MKIADKITNQQHRERVRSNAMLFRSKIQKLVNGESSERLEITILRLDGSTKKHSLKGSLSN